MEIVILRHGQTDLNKQYKIQGAQGDAPLNEMGITTSKNAAKNFDPTQFDAVYVSPLTRAKQTAEIFVKGTQKIIVDPRIREMDFGSWEGKDPRPLMKEHPDAFDPWGLISPNYTKYAKNAESFEDLEKRVADFFDDIIAKHQDDKILVVCHGAISRMMAAHFLSDGNMELFQQVHNSAMMKFEIRDNIARLIYYDKLLG